MNMCKLLFETKPKVLIVSLNVSMAFDKKKCAYECEVTTCKDHKLCLDQAEGFYVQ